MSRHMSKAHPPKLTKFMDKKLSLKLTGGRHVQGILRGFDSFMNIMVDECVQMATTVLEWRLSIAYRVAEEKTEKSFLLSTHAV